MLLHTSSPFRQINTIPIDQGEIPLKRNLRVITILLIIALITDGLAPAPCTAAEPPSHLQNPQADSRELQLQDMLVLQLLPYMNDRLKTAYFSLLITSPQLYPYLVQVEHIERVNGFRSFGFRITLRAFPTVGPHISVGEDLFTYRISSSQVELVEYKHIKGPEVHGFPPNYLDMLRKDTNEAAFLQTFWSCGALAFII